jgi:hypothetical protein
MKRLKKLIIWALVIAICVIILFVGAVMLFFPKEKAKQMAMERISMTLGREVAIDGISVSIWGGIGAYLEGIRISNPEGFEEKDFLTARALDVKLQFWPLLKRQIVVDRLILIEPQILLQKLKDGTINYQFGVVDSLAPAAVQEKLPEESKLAVSAISFENLAVKDGRLNYVDDSTRTSIHASGIKLDSKVRTPAPMVFQTSGNLSIDSFEALIDTLIIPSLAIKAKYDATYNQADDKITLSESAVNVNGIDLMLKAEVPEFAELNRASIEISTEQIDISQILTLVPKAYESMLEDLSVAGKVALNATIEYDATIKDTFQYKGSLAVSDVRLSSAEYPGEFLISSARAEFETNAARLDIDNASFDGNPLRATLAITGFDNPTVDGKTSGTFDLASLGRYLPETGDPKLAGNMSFDMKFQGPIKDPGRINLNGSLSIKDASYSAATLPEPIETFSLNAKVDSRDVIIDNMNAEFPSSDFTMKGKLADAFPYFIPGYEKEARKPYLTFEMKSQRFDVDRLFPEAVPGEGENLAKLPLDSLPPILLPDIDGKGKAKIDTLIYYRVEFTNITGDVSIKDRVIYVTNAKGNVYTGRITGETRVDLNDFENPKYSGTYNATEIEADDFLTRFTKFGGHLFGKVNMSGDFSASGWESEQLVNSLSMNGKALFNQARLVNFEPILKLAETLNFKTFKEETIKDLASAFWVADGRLGFDTLKFLSGFGDWDITGSVGFDGSLNYSGDVLLSEKVTSDLLSQSGLVSGLARMLKDDKSGRVNVPFKLTGTYLKPKIAADLSVTEKVQEELKDELKDKAADALKKLFKKK